MPTSDVIVLPATAADAQGIAEVHVASWQRAYKGILPDAVLASLSVADRAAMWAQIIDQQSAQVWVAKCDEKTFGFVSFGASRDADATPCTFEIHAIYVEPSQWSRGIGHALMQLTVKQVSAESAELVTLWVLADNARAIRFYEQAGFVLEQGASKSITLGGATLLERRFMIRGYPNQGVFP
jgi:ribosomal protein S18 acetylase RimI-like enzyme